MSTNYPEAIDNFVNPTPSDYEDVLSHAGQHSNENDAITAIEQVLGTTAGSAVLSGFPSGEKALSPSSVGTLSNKTIGTANTLGLGSDATGDLLYNNGGTITRLPIGTSDQVLSSNGTTPSWQTLSVGDWRNASGTLAYGTYDSNYKTGFFTTSSDLSGVLSPGMRLKFTQTTDGTKYGIITSVAAGSIGAFLGTAYDLDNESITSPQYSSVKSPYGFNCDPNAWKQEITSGSALSVTNGTAWGNASGLSLYIPIGAWNVEYFGLMFVDMDSSTTIAQAWTTLGTANNAETDAEFTSSGNFLIVTGASSGDQQSKQMQSKRKFLTLSQNTRYYLNNKTTTGTFGAVQLKGDEAKTVIRAVNAYL